MNIKFTSPIALAALSLSLTCMAQSPVAGEREATQMVPAQAALKQSLDARKLAPGATFQAVLATKAELTSGPVLPAGTVLIGQVIEDGMTAGGPPRLALRFTTAQLKDGQTLPIRATIVDYQQPEDIDTESHPITPGQQLENFWTAQTLEVNQLDALSHVDMHSDIASPDSAVFTAHNNKDVKLRAGSELQLAIAAER
jgi:hypothetical protein